VYQEIAAVLGPRASASIANSALPCAPVLPESALRGSSITRSLRRLISSGDRQVTVSKS